MFLSRSKRIGAVVATAVAAAAVLTACSSGAASTQSDQGTFAQDSKTLIVGNLPDETNGEAGYQPVADYLAKETGLKVKFLPTTSYDSLIAAAVAGKVDVFTAGALEYEQVKNKGGDYSPVSLQMSPGSSQPGYYSEAWVPKNSSITSVSQFKGKKVCFVSPSSTSGFLFGLNMLSEAGISVKQTGTDASGNPTFADFTAIFAGSHPKSAQSIAAGQCDVGFADDVDTTAYVGGLKSIQKEFVPGVPWEVSNALPAAVKAKVTKALQTANPDTMKAAGITITDAYSKSNAGVVPFEQKYYDTIDSLCKNIAAANCSK
ncbi:MAG: phosphate/phosphite/phosphonate ABC transporter substrate-binding protein [Microbacteriaceae bacterium]|nr:phosphate/phosphite/phosphonate ABC transporter substrate-binding protein [Microbacteriaceae bacterium]MCL2795085.1 phosphate/phosphite/phosphonate ABC transporter substrate-binding protein [Microbacteriaceae bacterium]